MKNWFARRELTPVGPFTEEDVRRRMLAGEISPEDLLWKDGENAWRAAIEWPEFKRLHVPAYQLISGVQPWDDVWIVLRKAPGGFRTLGPWSKETILEKIRLGEVRDVDHVWMKGMSGWARISSRPDFFISSDPGSPSPP
ncbi:MAG TPA: GYF domain-containing protein [Pseudobdellovibrionaceae bacterium]|nr:GYF domain-containing protein [Pseudobdellovibrionaceae bacterium]